MAERFDPYHKWLGIPLEERPPSYYRLLGIPVYESDQEVIASAAVQRMNWLRKFQSGENGVDAKRLSKEIADVWACLLNPQRKQEYDLQLRAQFAELRNAYQDGAAAPAPPTAAIMTAEAFLPFFATDKSSAPDSPLYPEYVVPPPYTPANAAELPHRTDQPFYNDGFDRAAPRLGRNRSRKRKKASVLPMIIAPFAGLLGGYLVLCMISPKYDVLNVFTEREAPQRMAPAVASKNAEKHRRTSTPTSPKRISPAIVKKQSTVQTPLQLMPPPEQPTKQEPPAAVSSRLKVPKSESQQRPKAIIAETYKAGLESAKTSEGKVKIIGKILQDALETIDAPTQYAALQTAQKLAEELGEIVVALEVVAKLGERFEVDTFNEQVAILSKVQFTPDVLARMPQIIQFLDSRWEDGLNADRYDFIAGVARFISKAHRAAAETPPSGVASAMIAMKAPSQTAQNLVFAEVFATAAKTFEALANSPTDAKANTAAGRFLCFVLDKWEFGLIRLSNGADETLREIAKADMASSKTAEQQVDVADRLMQLAAEDVVNAFAIKKRALDWYRSALPRLSGVHKTRVENRIAEILPSVTQPTEGDSAPDSPPVAALSQTARELEQAANQCRTAREALAIYHEFVANKAVSDSEKQLATRRLPFWAEIATKDYRRLGNKWIPPDELVLAKEEIRNTMLRAMESASSDSKEAIRLLEKAAGIDSDAVQPHFLLGMVRAVTQHDYAKAKSHFGKCQARDPQDSFVLNNMAIATAMTGEHPKAVNLFRQALVTAPNPAHVLHNVSLAVQHSVDKSWAVTTASTAAYKKLSNDFNAKAVGASSGRRGWIFLIPIDKEGDTPYSELLRGSYSLLELDGVEDRACIGCSGSGSITCGDCGGRGWVNSRRQVVIGQTPDGNTHYKTVVDRNNCQTCGGDRIRDCPRCTGGVDPGSR